MDEDNIAADNPIAPVEKMLPQSQVNELIGREKAAVAERVKREMQEQFENQQATQPVGGMAPAVDANAIREQIMSDLREQQMKADEEADKLRLEKEEAEFNLQLENVGKRYTMKMAGGKDKYSDFEDVMKGYDLNAFPHAAFLATEMELTSDIMYELAKNTNKLVYINQLAEKSPQMAQAEMQKLEDSIKKNQEAVEGNPSIPAPLARPQSSPTAGTDNGQMTINDYKNASWLRG